MMAPPAPNSGGASRRILLVVRPAAGGIRQHVLGLIEGLNRQGFAPSLAGPTEFLRQLPQIADLPTYPLAISPTLSPLSDLRAAVRLSVLAGRADVIHAHGLRAAWVAALAHLLRPFPLVVTVHNLVEGPGRVACLALRWIGGRAERVIAVSQAVADGLAAQGVPRSKIIVVPNGVDVARFCQLPDRQMARQELGVEVGAFAIGCIARLSPEKGVDVLLEAAARMPDTTFVIAGDGPERATLAACLPASVRLLGRIADTRLLLGAVDVLAVPSRQEGQGIVALEAMAAGVPVVASRVGGLAEMLTDGGTALLIPPGDYEALAAALERLRGDETLRGKLTANGLTLVRERYDVREMVRAVEGVYEGGMGG